MSIDPNEVRVILRAYGIDDSQYTDEELEHLIQYYTRLFNSLICFNYLPCDYEEYYPVNDSTKAVLINHYPVIEVSSITLDEKDYTNNVYRIEKDTGIIYFKENIMGDLILKYHAGWSDKDIETIIIPLILDLLVYGIRYGVDGIVSSISEGDVSVSFSITEKSLNINSRLNDLNKRFCPKARMI
jgi:hypothetical protein